MTDEEQERVRTEGVRARRAGLWLDANPYLRDSQAAIIWEVGWLMVDFIASFGRQTMH